HEVPPAEDLDQRLTRVLVPPQLVVEFDHRRDLGYPRFEALAAQVLARQFGRWIQVVEGARGPDPEAVEAARNDDPLPLLRLACPQREAVFVHAVHMVPVSVVVPRDLVSPLDQDLIHEREPPVDLDAVARNGWGFGIPEARNR